MPQRIQRQRKPGWRMPEGVVYVGRPSPWANPFPVSMFVRDASIKDPYGAAVYGFRHWLEGDKNWSYHFCETERRYILEHVHELAGKDLACWCSPHQKCHADVLLELANKERPDGLRPEIREGDDGVWQHRS